MPNHDGLYGVVNNLGWIVQAALRPRPIANDDADEDVALVAPDALPTLKKRR